MTGQRSGSQSGPMTYGWSQQGDFTNNKDPSDRPDGASDVVNPIAQPHPEVVQEMANKAVIMANTLSNLLKSSPDQSSLWNRGCRASVDDSIESTPSDNVEFVEFQNSKTLGFEKRYRHRKRSVS
jgi:hypothetical protein